MTKTTKKNKASALNTSTPRSTKIETTAAAAPQLQPPGTTGNAISLELVKPDAQKVYVAGSFNQWKPETTPLLPAGNGRWVGNLKVKPGRHEYLFVVDGQWVPDPNAREFVNNPFGGRNSVLVVSE